jgi:hypothetical protein
VLRPLLIAFCAGVILPALHASVEARTRPYSAHEFRLGMTLSDFRQLDRFGELDPSERLVCSNDGSAHSAQLRPAEEFVEAGAIACGLVAVVDDPDPELGTIEIFGNRVRASFLFYQPAAAREPRLIQMLVVLSNRNFERLATLFRRTYGDSPIVEVVGGVLLSGASVSNMIYSWRNGVSTIQLEMYAISIENARATFLYDAAWDELLAAVRRIRFGG